MIFTGDLALPGIWFGDELLQELGVFVQIWIFSTIFYWITQYTMGKKEEFTKWILIMCAPGIIIHEASHYLFCKIFLIKVSDVQFFDFREQGGHVSPVNNAEKGMIANFFISFGPLVIGTIIIHLLAGALTEENLWIGIQAFLGWIVCSLFISAGPSYQDTRIFFVYGFKDGTLVLRDLIIIIVSFALYWIYGSKLTQAAENSTSYHLVWILMIQLVVFVIAKLLIKLINAMLQSQRDRKFFKKKSRHIQKARAPARKQMGWHGIDNQKRLGASTGTDRYVIRRGKNYRFKKGISLNKQKPRPKKFDTLY